MLDFLHGIDVVEILDGNRPIRTAKSSIIGLVGTAGKGPLNTPVLIIGNRREGQAIFGAPAVDGFTIPGALKAIFDVTGAMVVVINVADPTQHKTTVATTQNNTFVGRSLTLPHNYISDFATTTAIKAPFTLIADGVLVLPTGCTFVSVKDPTDVTTLVLANLHAGDKVIVHYTATLAAGVDYTLDADTGVITSPSTGSKILPNATIVTGYKYMDSTLIDASDIVGAVVSGNFTGVQALAAAKSTVFVQPRLLVAPGYTHQKVDASTANAVVASMVIMAGRLGGVVIADTPSTTKEDAVAYQQDFAASDRVYPHYPFYRVLSPAGDASIMSEPASARIAGLVCKSDNERGFWNSPSNQAMPGILGLDKPIDFALSSPDTVANYLNSNNVVTTIFEQGLRLWGNRVADGTFFSGRRIADMVEESIRLGHLWAVDRNITKAYVETVVEGVNDYLRTLTAQGAILGGKAWCDPTLNTNDVIADGHLFIDFEFTRPTPAEHLTFQAHLVNDYIATIFDVNS